MNLNLEVGFRMFRMQHVILFGSLLSSLLFYHPSFDHQPLWTFWGWMHLTETSLDRQKQLLEHQKISLEVLQTVTSFQSQALEESRETLQKLIEFGRSQHQELLQRQEQLKQANDHLVQNSKNYIGCSGNF